MIHKAIMSAKKQDQLLIAGLIGLGLLAFMGNTAGQGVPDTDSAVVLLWHQLGSIQKRASIAFGQVDKDALEREGKLDELVRQDMLTLRRELHQLREVGDEAFDARRQEIINLRRESDDYAGELDIEAHVADHDKHAESFLSQIDQLAYDLKSVMDDSGQFGMVNLQYNAVAMQKKSLELNQEVKVLIQQDRIVQQQFNQEVHVHADEVSQHLHQQNFLNVHNELFDDRVINWHGGPPNDFGGGNGPGGWGGHGR